MRPVTEPNDCALKLVRVPAGEFVMESPASALTATSFHDQTMSVNW